MSGAETKVVRRGQERKVRGALSNREASAFGLRFRLCLNETKKKTHIISTHFTVSLLL